MHNHLSVHGFLAYYKSMSLLYCPNSKGFSRADDEENPHEAYGYTAASAAGIDKESHEKGVEVRLDGSLALAIQKVCIIWHGSIF